MKRVVITGATGFIGKALSLKLLKQGIKVYAIDIDQQKLNELKRYGDVVTIEAKFQDYEKIDNKFNEEIDVFYHFAWNGVFGQAFEDYELQLLNAKYCADALMLARKLGCKKFVLAGTSNEYTINKYLTQDYFEPRFTCIYSTAKVAAEMICKTLAYNYGIEYNSGLIAMVYGEGNFSKMLPNIVIDNLMKGIRPKLIEGHHPYDMIYIDDVVEAFYRIGKSGVNMKSYYIGHRKTKAFKDVMTEIKNILNPEMKLVFGEYKGTTDIDYSHIDLEALYLDTGFECTSDFKTSILRTAQWIKEMKAE